MEKYKHYRDKEKRKAYNREYQRKYIQRYREKLKAEGRKLSSNAPEYTQRLRLRALKKLGGAVCVNCGCSQESILEINHIEGGGRQQRKGQTAKQFYLDIIYDRVDVKRLNILCKVCNIQHYVEIILGVSGHSVSWKQ